MKTGLVLLATYFVIAPIFILILVFYQSSLRAQERNLAVIKDANRIAAQEQTVDENILPLPPPPEKIEEVTSQAKINALQEFFGKYRSPLTTYAEEIVDAADRYGLDYRLLPAIAMQESTLCRRAPKDSNNCWGFGIYGGKVKRFSDFSQAIEAVSKTLAQEYHNKGLREPIQIMTKYTPANTKDCAQNVSYVMGRIGTAL